MATTTTDRYERMTREELYELAQEREVEGRSDMDKDALVAALLLTDLGPDAVALLERQHQRFRELFEEFRGLSSRSSQKKDDLVRTMITELVKHAEIEEQAFYPAVRAEVDGVEDDVDEDLEEHHAVELLLWELDHLRSDAERFDAKVTVLIENVEHHMEEEEQELFPKVREQMSEERRRELGAIMERKWKVAPSRPHPLSPSTPPGNVLMAVPAAIRDLAINVVRFGLNTIRRR
jgi:hemerythrin superfamily protein